MALLGRTNAVRGGWFAVVAAQRDMTSQKWKVHSNGVPIPPIRGTTQTRCGERPCRTFRADHSAGDVGAEGSQRGFAAKHHPLSRRCLRAP